MGTIETQPTKRVTKMSTEIRYIAKLIASGAESIDALDEIIREYHSECGGFFDDIEVIIEDTRRRVLDEVDFIMMTEE